MTVVVDKPKKRIGRPRSHSRATLVKACIELLLALEDKRIRLPLPARLKVKELRTELGHHERATGCVSDCPICYGTLVFRKSKSE